jgi:hypothetical protein
MLYVQLGALRQNLRQLFKGMCEKISFRVIVPGKRVCPLDNPVDIVGDMLEEPFAITRFEIPKDLLNIGGGQPLCIRNCGHVRNYLPMAAFRPPSQEFDPQPSTMVADLCWMIRVPTPHSQPSNVGDDNPVGFLAILPVGLGEI